MISLGKSFRHGGKRRPRALRRRPSVKEDTSACLCEECCEMTWQWFAYRWAQAVCKRHRRARKRRRGWA